MRSLLSSNMKRVFVISKISVVILMLSLTTLVKAQSATEFGFFESYQVAPGNIIRVPVYVRNVQDLYAVDFSMTFDPKIIQVVDADSSMPGIQIGLGDFLDPGMLLFNTANNDKGTVHFVMTQYNPSKPKSGEGVVVLIDFIALAVGESPLVMTDVTLASGQASKIEVQGVSSTITVLVGAPTQISTLPVAESSGLIVLGTSTPVATERPVPTLLAPISTMTATSTIMIDDKVAQQMNLEGNGEAKDGSGFWLVNNWWLVIILFLVVISFGIFLVRSRKNNSS